MAFRCAGMEANVMDEYLAFIDLIGMTVNGDYIYRLDFTTNTDSVWGDYFNVVPSAIIPNLQADINCISKTCKIILQNELVLAKNSYCFSMQDCIDGINPLCFSEINDNTITINDIPLFFRFGESYDEIMSKLSKIGVYPYDITDVTHGDYTAIDELLNDFDDGELI